jgi:hypothetical protein
MRMGMRRHQRLCHPRSHQLLNETTLLWKIVVFHLVMKTRMTRGKTFVIKVIALILNRTRKIANLQLGQVSIVNQGTVDLEVVDVMILLLPSMKDVARETEKIGRTWTVVDARIEMVIILKEVVESMIKSTTLLRMIIANETIRNIEVKMNTLVMSMDIDRNIIVTIVTRLVIVTALVIIPMNWVIVIMIEIVVWGRKMRDIIIIPLAVWEWEIGVMVPYEEEETE